MGNYLDFALKIAHRGNTGSHKGKRKLACLPENYICALLLFSLFLVYGIKLILLILVVHMKKSAPKSKN